MHWWMHNLTLSIHYCLNLWYAYCCNQLVSRSFPAEFMFVSYAEKMAREAIQWCYRRMSMKIFHLIPRRKWVFRIPAFLISRQPRSLGLMVRSVFMLKSNNLPVGDEKNGRRCVSFFSWKNSRVEKQVNISLHLLFYWFLLVLVKWNLI